MFVGNHLIQVKHWKNIRIPLTNVPAPKKTSIPIMSLSIWWPKSAQRCLAREVVPFTDGGHETADLLLLAAFLVHELLIGEREIWVREDRHLAHSDSYHRSSHQSQHEIA